MLGSFIKVLPHIDSLEEPIVKKWYEDFENLLALEGISNKEQQYRLAYFVSNGKARELLVSLKKTMKENEYPSVSQIGEVLLNGKIMNKFDYYDKLKSLRIKGDESLFDFNKVYLDIYKKLDPMLRKGVKIMDYLNSISSFKDACFAVIYEGANTIEEACRASEKIQRIYDWKKTHSYNIQVDIEDFYKEENQNAYDELPYYEENDYIYEDEDEDDDEDYIYKPEIYKRIYPMESIKLSTRSNNNLDNLNENTIGTDKENNVGNLSNNSVETNNENDYVNLNDNAIENLIVNTIEINKVNEVGNLEEPEPDEELKCLREETESLNTDEYGITIENLIEEAENQTEELEKNEEPNIQSLIREIEYEDEEFEDNEEVDIETELEEILKVTKEEIKESEEDEELNIEKLIDEVEKQTVTPIDSNVKVNLFITTVNKDDKRKLKSHNIEHYEDKNETYSDNCNLTKASKVMKTYKNAYSDREDLTLVERNYKYKKKFFFCG